MLVRKICAVLALLGLSFGYSCVAAVQSVSDVGRALEELNTIESRFAAARTNLNHMSRALEGADFDAANGLVLRTGQFYGLFEAAAWLGPVLTRGQCAEDLQLHQIVFQGAAKSLVKEADIELDTVNQLLTLIRSPAALAEATKIRDLMIQTRDIYKPLAAKD